MPVDRYASEYNMKHTRRGMAIIFNHEHFDIQSLKSRTGTNVDCENLKNTLERLSFDVTVHRDKRYNEIIDAVDRCKCINNFCSIQFSTTVYFLLVLYISPIFQLSLHNSDVELLWVIMTSYIVGFEGQPNLKQRSVNRFSLLIFEAQMYENTIRCVYIAYQNAHWDVIHVWCNLDCYTIPPITLSYYIIPLCISTIQCSRIDSNHDTMGVDFPFIFVFVFFCFVLLILITFDFILQCQGLTIATTIACSFQFCRTVNWAISMHTIHTTS